MTANIVAAIIAAFGAIAAAAVTYLFTKRKEREADWRKEKIAHYKLFIESMSGVVDGDATETGHLNFARATTNLLLVAPQNVLEALYAYRDEISGSNKNRTIAKHDLLLAKLLIEIRKDVGVEPVDNPQTFQPRLYASGIKPK